MLQVDEKTIFRDIGHGLIVLILVGIIVGLVSCDTPETIKQKALSQVEWIKRKSQVIVIDDCQYIYYGHFQHAGLTHKGNCDNPHHKDNQ